MRAPLENKSALGKQARTASVKHNLEGCINMLESIKNLQNMFTPEDMVDPVIATRLEAVQSLLKEIFPEKEQPLIEQSPFIAAQPDSPVHLNLVPNLNLEKEPFQDVNSPSAPSSPLSPVKNNKRLADDLIEEPAPKRICLTSPVNSVPASPLAKTPVSTVTISDMPVKVRPENQKALAETKKAFNNPIYKEALFDAAVEEKRPFEKAKVVQVDVRTKSNGQQKVYFKGFALFGTPNSVEDENKSTCTLRSGNTYSS